MIDLVNLICNVNMTAVSILYSVIHVYMDMMLFWRENDPSSILTFIQYKIIRSLYIVI